MNFNPLADQLVTVMSTRELCAMIDDMNTERRDPPRRADWACGQPVDDRSKDDRDWKRVIEIDRV